MSRQDVLLINPGGTRKKVYQDCYNVVICYGQQANVLRIEP